MALTSAGFRKLKQGTKLVALKDDGSDITKGKKYSFISISEGCGGTYLTVSAPGSQNYIYPYSFTGLFGLAKKTAKKAAPKKTTKTKAKKTVKA